MPPAPAERVPLAFRNSVGVQKQNEVPTRMSKIVWRYVYPFRHNTSFGQTDELVKQYSFQHAKCDKDLT